VNKFTRKKKADDKTSLQDPGLSFNVRSVIVLASSASEAELCSHGQEDDQGESGGSGPSKGKGRETSSFPELLGADMEGKFILVPAVFEAWCVVDEGVPVVSKGESYGNSLLFDLEASDSDAESVNSSASNAKTEEDADDGSEYERSFINDADVLSVYDDSDDGILDIWLVAKS
jgi:hypothetical protein